MPGQKMNAVDDVGELLSNMLGAEYHCVRWTGRPGVTNDDIGRHLHAHVTWMIDLERAGHLLASGPLIDGEGIGPGDGLTILRTESVDAAADLAAEDPFVVHGLRTYEIATWRLMEGSFSINLSLSTGTYRFE